MFERLPTIPTSSELLDRAFRRGSKAAKLSTKDGAMVRTAGSIISDSLSSLVRGFPSFENLPPFYYDLVDAALGVDELRIHLSRIGWASKQIRKVSRGKMSDDSGSVRSQRGALGRMASIMRSIEPDLVYLSDARYKLSRFPRIDPSLPTIIIAGYPNVGKSSFLRLVTKARPEVASYPFTTKGLAVGHHMRNDVTFQIVDTPGLLDRPLEERNDIERQAVVALKHLNGVVIFIMDPSEHCGYPISRQLDLLSEIKTWLKLPMLEVSNKSDLAIRPGTALMSTLTGEGVTEVLDKAVDLLSDA